METTALRQFLKGLCNNSRWDYAVFWKLRHRIPTVLSWEDGCCNEARPGTLLEISSNMLYFDGSSEMSFFDGETSVISGTANQYPFELLMADMSGLQHTLGEGFVGKVACTYNYCWISSEDISASQFEHDKPLEFPEEWLPHLLAGIKTVVLVSVHPHGVLELGSSEEVPEDAELVNLIKEAFLAHQLLSGFATPPTLEDDQPLRSSQSSDDMDEPTGTVVDNLVGEELPDDSEEANESLASIFGSLQEISEDLEKNKDLIHSAIGLSGVLIPLKEPPEWSPPEMALLGADLSLEFSNRIMDSYNVITGPCGDEEEDAEYTGFENLSSMFSIPMDCDLFEALGPSLQSQAFEFPGYEASLMEIRDSPDGMEPSAWELGECEAKFKPEDLLGAVIANFCDRPDGTSPNNSETLTSPASTVVQCDPIPPSKSLNKSENTFVGSGNDNSVLWSNTETTFATRTGNSSSKHSNSVSSKSTVRCLTDKGQPTVGQKHQLSGSKRKGRSGDNHRPRPRDRQLIQDRVKELRELVPNGSKCSIDALLDRTVKHMLFLRSVTNQAEKLRKCVPPKESRPKIWKSLGIDEEDCEKKRGWSFDFGSELQVFPIVVEDLEYPGQMLIEMMCDEQGLFLEIAQVIRRLELMILKGVMETRPDSTWARFVVEASKGFQRTEIFWPLMQVLQQRGKPVAGAI